jgi:pimeloyl-ACP methyl ester carboxylesterase
MYAVAADGASPAGWPEAPTLPDVPAKLDASGAPQGYDTVELPFHDGLAYYLPPEAYPHRDDGDSFHHGDRGLNDQETCPIAVELRVHPLADPIGASIFELRRAPIVFAHGLFGSSDQHLGHDRSQYWSPWIYTEAIPETSAPNSEGWYSNAPFNRRVDLPGSPLPTRLFFFDYESTNIIGFDKNANKLGEFVLDVLAEYRTAPTQNDKHFLDDSPWRGNAGVGGIDRYGFVTIRFDETVNPWQPIEVIRRQYAIARVDLVGHSMGGNIIRYYTSALGTSLQPASFGNSQPRSLDGRPLDGWNHLDYSRPAIANPHGTLEPFHAGNWFAGPARRIITIGTPHRGSPMGDLVTRMLTPPATVPIAGSNGQLAREDLTATPHLLRSERAARSFGKLLGLVDPAAPFKIARIQRIVTDGQYPTAFADLAEGSGINKTLLRKELYPLGMSIGHDDRWDPMTLGRRSIVWHPIGSVAVTDTPGDAPIMSNKLDLLLHPDSDWYLVAVGINLSERALDPDSFHRDVLTTAFRSITELEDDNSDGVVKIMSQFNSAGDLAILPGEGDANGTGRGLFSPTGTIHSGSNLPQGYNTQTYRNWGMGFLLGGYRNRLDLGNFGLTN